MPQEVIQPINPISPISPISVPSPQQGTTAEKKYSFSEMVKLESEKLRQNKPLLTKETPVKTGDEWRKPILDPILMSVPDERGWLRKQVDDVKMLASGLYHMAHATWDNAFNLDKDIAYIVKELLRDPEIVRQQSTMVLRDMIKGATNHYRDSNDEITFNSVLTGFKDHSVLAMMDILGVASMGAGALIKTAPTMGKIASSLGVTGTRAMPIIKDGIITGTRMANIFETGMLDAGRLIQSIPSKALDAALAGAEKLPGAKGILTSYGITQRAREFARMLGTYKLDAARDGHQAAMKSLKLKVSKAEWDDFNDIMMGAKSWNKSLYSETFNKKIEAIVKVQREYIDTARVESRKWASGPITEEALRFSKIKHLKDYLQQKLGREVSVDETWEVFVKNMAETADLNPEGFTVFSDAFRPAVPDLNLTPEKFFKAMFEIDPAFGQTGKRVSAMERFFGRAKYSRDPDIWHTNYIVANAQLQGISRGFRGALAEYGRVWRKDAEAPEGWVHMPEPYMRYFDDAQEANGLAVKRLSEGEAKFGPDTPEAYAYMWDQIRSDLQLRADDLVKSMQKGDLQIIVPEDIAKAIDFELAPVMGWTRWYNHGLNIWRKFVLDWSPRYYVNNILGNAVLMTLGGVNPKYLQTKQFSRTAVEAHRSTLRMEELGLMASIGRTRAGRAVQEAVDFGTFSSDAWPRIVTLNSYYAKALKEKGIQDTLVKKFVPDKSTRLSDLDRIEQAGFQLVARSRAAQANLLLQSAPDLGLIDEGGKLEALRDLKLRDDYLKAQDGVGKAERSLADTKQSYRDIERELGQSLGLELSPQVEQVPTIRPSSARPLAGRTEEGLDLSTESGILAAMPRLQQRQALAGARFQELEHRIEESQKFLKQLESDVPVHGAGGPYTSARTLGREAETKAAEVRARLTSDIAERAQLSSDINRMSKIGKRAGQLPAHPLKKRIAEKSFELDEARRLKSELMADGEAALGRIGMMTRGQTIQAKRQMLGGERLREALENSGQLQAYLKEIEPFTAPAEAAIKQMEMLLGGYGRGSPFARKYIRNVIPFWTFMATMHRLAFHMPVWRPKTTMLFSQMAQAAVDGFDDDKFPGWARESMPIGTTEDDNGNPMMVLMRIHGLNPFESIGIREIGKLDLPKLMDPTQSPLIGMIVKVVGGYDTFTQELPDWREKEIFDMMGRTWRYDGKGGFVKTSRQTPLLDTFFEMIPQTQIFNDIMAHVGFQLPGRKAKVHKSPSGETVLSRPWQYGISRWFGLTMDKTDLKQAKIRERLQTIRLAKQYMRAAARNMDIDSQERAQIFKEAGYVLKSMK